MLGVVALPLAAAPPKVQTRVRGGILTPPPSMAQNMAIAIDRLRAGIKDHRDPAQGWWITVEDRNIVLDCGANIFQWQYYCEISQGELNVFADIVASLRDSRLQRKWHMEFRPDRGPDPNIAQGNQRKRARV
ncbi:predicted protein [Histoplasma capsulatum var. duboisii H88]|uniref:Predicted protein n=1 Tax=Ajellomyces capsulatus (strain H88) TaxID=544711 RepID=F0UGS8_AJEC8|nr:predicted protein [Histoplasma capsulatum var. duboisii H88]QSS55937.1 hypothetical protein I7I53_03962 [Histoplasma capsulatum var. duboisii H88]